MVKPFVSQVPERLDGIEVIYTDLDGTMLGARGSFLHDPEGESSLEPARALLAAVEAGITVVPTSGRALRGLLTDGRMLGLSDVIAEMGAQIAYGSGSEIVENFGATPEPGPPARVMEASGALELLLERFDIEPHLPWSRWRECTHLFRGTLDTARANAELREAGFGWMALHDNGRLGGDGERRVYHLQPAGVSKGSAVALDRARRGVAREACLGIGDALADLTLSDQVGTLVLVRQAVEHDDQLAGALEDLPNIAVTDRRQNLGWADTVMHAARVRR